MLAALPALAHTPQTGRDTIKRSFAVQDGGTLIVDVDFGNVTVNVTNDDMVYVEIERLIDIDDENELKRVLSRHDWEINKDGNNVLVESRFDREDTDDSWFRRRRHNNLRINVIVSVPARYGVDFTTGAGNVTIADVAGDVEGKTGAGSIELGRIDGDVHIRSGSGNIDIAGVTGSLEVSSGAGNMTLGSVNGELDATTGAGNIDVYLTEQPRTDSNVESGAGNVTVFLASGVGVDVDARASVGSASSDFGLAVEGKWMSKSFEGEVNGGGPALTLRSGVGNVSLKRR
jgi:hypothetical protein